MFARKVIRQDRYILFAVSESTFPRNQVNFIFFVASLAKASTKLAFSSLLPASPAGLSSLTRIMREA
jgi:hypothetical protein